MIVVLGLLARWTLANAAWWTLADRLDVSEVRAEVSWPRPGAPRGVHLSPAEVRELEAKLEESFTQSVLRPILTRKGQMAAILGLDVRGEDIMEVRSAGQPRFHVPANLSTYFYPSGLAVSNLPTHFYWYSQTNPRIVYLKSIDNASVRNGADSLLVDALVSRGCRSLLSSPSVSGR